MPIRVLLSDDETLARERLRSLLEEEEDLEIVAECGDGKSAIATIERERPDLVFLDIQMPEVDGFGVVQELRDAMPLTIFVTAYDRYAMKAFEVHALDYLLKARGQGAPDKLRWTARVVSYNILPTAPFSAASWKCWETWKPVSKLPSASSSNRMARSSA